jgi:hypothetical protein
MAATIYYDNLDSRSATLTDGTTGSFAFNSSDVLSNELRAVDGNITDVIGGWAVNEGLQFNFGTAVNPTFCAIYSTVATGNDILIQRDNAASGTFNGIINTINDLAVGWNIRTLTALQMQYWTINSAVGDLTGISEIFFGNPFELPVQPTANIITAHNFGSEEVKALGANRYYFSKHDNFKTLTLSLDHMTSANKTSLETFANTVTDREPFIYSEDGTTGPFHWVRLVRPLTFRQIAPDIYSTQLVLRELTA